MLDGVFNHTGRKSVYFNADGFYDDLGAAQGEQSPYYRWYNFHPFPDEYDAWWGIKNLPAVNELEKSYVDYIIEATTPSSSAGCARAHPAGGSTSPTSSPTSSLPKFARR